MKLYTKLPLIVILVAFMTTACSVVHGIPMEDESRLALSADGLDNLNADCGAGSLKIKGVEGLKEIEVEATLVVRGIGEERLRSFKDEYVELSLEKRGNSAVLKSNIKNTFSSIFKGKSAHINLDIRVPKGFALDIEDGSGLITISTVTGGIKLDDGSGSIEINTVEGKIDIEDGSGSIDIWGVKGDIVIDDGSGSIQLKEISGDVDVDDNSGNIDIKLIGGSVTVEDGSGGIYIDGVDKNVVIKRAGSGAVSINNVKGTVKK